jgi:hypothetical protein
MREGSFFDPHKSIPDLRDELGDEHHAALTFEGSFSGFLALETTV